MREMPFQLIKPIKGGPPNQSLYQSLASSPDWLCQAKLNGKRALWDGHTLWSRQGNVIEGEVEEALKGISTMFDGEWVRGVYYIFDLPDSPHPLSDRVQGIESIVDLIDSPYVRMCPIVQDWTEVRKNEWEGVVFKRKSSRYRRAHVANSETSDWVKFRAEWEV